MKNAYKLFGIITVAVVVVLLAACPTEQKADSTPAPTKYTVDTFTLGSTAFTSIFKQVPPEENMQTEITGAKAELNAMFATAKNDPSYKSLGSQSISEDELKNQMKEGGASQAEIDEALAQLKNGIIMAFSVSNEDGEYDPATVQVTYAR